MHTAIALANGGLLTFGWALKGQLGLADPDQRYHRPAAAAAAAEDQLLPAAVAACLSADPGRSLTLPVVAHVAAGQQHTVIVTADGRVFTCGDAWLGALGYQCPQASPQRLFRQVDLACAAGMGQGATPEAAIGTAYAPAAASAAAGGFHTVVLLRDGHLVSFGSNSSGQLGRGDCGRRRAEAAEGGDSADS